MWQPQGLFNQFVLRTPVVLSGERSIQGLYNYPASRIAVIHGSSFGDKDTFRAAFPGKDVRFFGRSWQGEPDIEGLAGTVAGLEDFRPDTIVAAGGGSVIDGAKLCRLLYEFPYFDMDERRIGGEGLRTHFVAVPTTVGSGAEVSSAAVFIDREKERKDMIVLHELQPDVIVYDSRYVENTPVRILCASVLDAAAHMIEGYVSKTENGFADVMAEKGLSIIHGEMKKVLSGEAADMARLQYAGYLGGIVQNHCVVGAAHALAHQLGGHGYSHGEAVGLLMPAVTEMNSADGSVRSGYTRLAEEAGLDGADGIRKMYEDILGFSGIGGRREDLKALLADLCGRETFRDNVRADRGGAGNPLDMTDEFIEQTIRSI